MPPPPQIERPTFHFPPNAQRMIAEIITNEIVAFRGPEGAAGRGQIDAQDGYELAGRIIEALAAGVGIDLPWVRGAEDSSRPGDKRS